MKRLEIIIRADKLEALQAILNSYSGGITVATVMGCGKQKKQLSANGTKTLKVAGMNMLPKLQVTVVVKDSVVAEILNRIHEKISSGKVGDGKVFITDIEDAMRIRTGERGEKAL
jgi:nitrogen regulatory protein P-II 1